MGLHPGQMLNEKFMKPLGISPSELARRLDVNRSTVRRLLNGQSNITPQMAARLGALFQVPARWWLQMQLEFDAQHVSAHPELSEGAVPLEIDPDLLITPKGIMHLGESVAPPPQAMSLSIAELQQLPPGPAPERRRAQQVHYANGSIALVGEIESESNV